MFQSRFVEDQLQLPLVEVGHPERFRQPGVFARFQCLCQEWGGGGNRQLNRQASKMQIKKGYMSLSKYAGFAVVHLPVTVKLLDNKMMYAARNVFHWSKLEK